MTRLRQQVGWDLTDMDPLTPAEPLSVPDLERYWNDPVFAAEQEAEVRRRRALCHLHFDRARDAGLRKADLL